MTCFVFLPYDKFSFEFPCFEKMNTDIELLSFILKAKLFAFIVAMKFGRRCRTTLVKLETYLCLFPDPFFKVRLLVIFVSEPFFVSSRRHL